MTLISRYMFRQLLWTLAGVAFALAAIALLSQSLGALDLIVDQRQSADIFLKVTALALPQLVALVLPIATFVGVLIALNRMQQDHELVVAKTAGMSRWALASPALRLGILAGFLILVANLWIQPLAAREMRELLFSAKTDLASVLVKEGSFTHPTSDLTVYAGSRESGGHLKNILLHDATDPTSPVTYLAEDGQIVVRDDVPALVMNQGSRQSLSTDGRYGFLSFDEYVFDLKDFVKTDDEFFLKLSDRYLHELLFPDMTRKWERENTPKVWAEAHYRLSSPLYAPVFALIAIVAVIGGSFSRMGYGRRIAVAAVAALFVRLLGFAAQSAAVDVPMVNLVQYIIPIGAAFICLRMLIRQPRQAKALMRVLKARAQHEGGAHAVR